MVQYELWFFQTQIPINAINFFFNEAMLREEHAALMEVGLFNFILKILFYILGVSDHVQGLWPLANRQSIPLCMKVLKERVSLIMESTI